MHGSEGGESGSTGLPYPYPRSPKPLTLATTLLDTYLRILETGVVRWLESGRGSFVVELDDRARSSPWM